MLYAGIAWMFRIDGYEEQQRLRREAEWREIDKMPVRLRLGR